VFGLLFFSVKEKNFSGNIGRGSGIFLYELLTDIVKGVRNEFD